MLLLLLATLSFAAPESAPSSDAPATVEAGDETPTDPDTGVPAEPEPLIPPDATAPALVHQAADRMTSGDLDGADLLLAEAQRRGPDDRVQLEIDYQTANVLALRGAYADAREVYAAIAARPDTHRTLDSRFRVAELTGVLGDPEGALAGFNDLRPWGRLPDEDQSKIALNRAWFTLQTGDTRRGMRRLRRALRKTETGTVSFYEAKAWAGIARAYADEAARVPIEGTDRKLRKRLAEREVYLAGAGSAVGQAVALQEPEWVLEGLLALADGFEQLGDDLLEAPEPSDLTEEQLLLYRQGMREQAVATWMRAEVFLSKGVEVADQLAWHSDRVPRMRDHLARLRQRIEEG